jgi:hypothetical protein
MLEVADSFRRYGPAYLDAYGDKIPARHRRVIQDLVNCRTAALGGHVYTCDHCGQTLYAYHSCRNRHCPKCHTDQTAAWLAQRRAELLPVPYYHVVFTVPEELRPFVRRYPRELYDVLMKTAARSLMKLAADPRYIGGQVGILAVLHSWTGTLLYHPHVHVLVTGGGIAPDRTQWCPARRDYLVPVQALSRIFRGMFRDQAKKALPQVAFPPSAWTKDWVVFAKPAVQGTDRVLEYLGRYVHRVALTNRRIVDIENGRVTFRYKDSATNEQKTVTVTAFEFIRRFLQHVLPARVHKVRYFGLWSPANRPLLHRLQLLLAPPAAASPTVSPRESAPPARRCPTCGQGTLVCTGRLPRPSLDCGGTPPLERAPPP